ncbi:DNA-binding protein [Fastidiosibacter lacustris]|uniref:DNA-binding protein n=1 Tax=Fastidiosibacter lacustris TaxID=2056695 RepID=UPI000E351E2C|nr:DNA-binding protein [Fastidiosibacter lacustris]
MSEENQITYEEVSAIADRLNKEGRRVTLEYVRRELGKGTHAQIAVFLGRWQKENTHLSEQEKSKNRTQCFRDKNHDRSNAQGKERSNMLRRPDMSTFKEHRTHRQQQDELESLQKRAFARNSKPQFITNGNGEESYESIAPMEELTTERLQKEPVIIQKLFQAMIAIKAARAVALEEYQQAQSELLSTRMECDQKVREFKKYANEQLLALQSEYSRLKAITEREVIAIRQQLDI